MEGFEWTIQPSGTTGSSDRWISMDIPTLPIHVPGMIPIGQVEKGYLDDLKKEVGNLETKELSPPSIPNAKMRMVRAAWKKDGRPMQQTALLMVHDDHVYIFRCRSDADHEKDTRATYDSVLSSVHWIKTK
jgi:hypothetical protein